MNTTHIHLLITHLPIFGALSGALVLAYAVFTRSIPTKTAAYLVFFVAAIGGAIAYFTGESAEESVEHLPGILESLIEEHEEAAQFAFAWQIVLGVGALLGFYINLRKPGFAVKFAWIMLVCSLLAFVSVARTGWLGGKIRHQQEIDGTAAVPEHGEESEEDHD